MNRPILQSFAWLLVATIVLAASACRDKPAEPTAQQAPTQPEQVAAPPPPPEPEAPAYAGPRKGDRLDVSGMRISVMEEGHGEAIRRDERVLARYRLLDTAGEVFDESPEDTPEMFDFDGSEPWTEALLVHHRGMASRIDVPAMLFSPRLRQAHDLSQDDTLVLELTIVDAIPANSNGTTP